MCAGLNSLPGMLARNELLSPIKLAHSTPSKATLDLEKLQSRCKQLQEELDKVSFSSPLPSIPTHSFPSTMLCKCVLSPPFPPSCCVLPSQTRHLLSSEREDFHMKETRLEANLVATKKANQELEVLYM